MLTPAFKVNQTEELIIVEITAKYSKEKVWQKEKASQGMKQKGVIYRYTIELRRKRHYYRYKRISFDTNITIFEGNFVRFSGKR